MEEKNHKIDNNCLNCNAIPKISEKFSCNHLLCERCLLRKCLTFTKSSYDTDFVIYCTKCDNGSNLNVNDFVSELMYEKNLLYKQKICDSCEENICELVCDNCEINFCTKCFNSFHAINQAFLDHCVNKKLKITDDNVDKILEPSTSPPKQQPSNNLNVSGFSNSSKLNNKRKPTKNTNEDKLFQIISNTETLINYFKKLFSEFKTKIRCNCPLQNEANFICKNCEIKICETCVLITHKFHSIVFDPSELPFDSKYENNKFLDQFSNRSELSMSPKNEIIKVEKDKPRPSIHHTSSSAKINQITQKISKKDTMKKITKDEEKLDPLIEEIQKIVAKTNDIEDFIIKCQKSKNIKIDESILQVNYDSNALQDFINKKLKEKTNNNKNNKSSSPLVVQANSGNSVININEKSLLDIELRKTIREEEKTIEKLILNLKYSIRELLIKLSDKEDKSILVSLNNKINSLYMKDKPKQIKNEEINKKNADLAKFASQYETFIEDFNIQKIQNLVEDFELLEKQIKTQEDAIMNIFFGHIANNPYAADNNENIVHFEYLELDEEIIQIKKPFKKKTQKNFRDTGVTLSCDVFNLKGFRITSSTNMSKDSYPSMMAVFQTSTNRDFLTYINNVNYEIIVLEFNTEFKFRNESFKNFYLDNKIKLRGHLSNINCIKYYYFKGKDILFSCSDDGSIKGWDCQEFKLEMNISYGETYNEPCFSLCCLTYNEDNYLLVGSYTKNAPIKVYNNLQGIILKYLPVQGYTYNIDSYIDETNELKFIFCSVFNHNKYEVLMFDFASGEKVLIINTLSYVHSFYMTITNENTYTFTFVDRTGTLQNYKFNSGQQPQKQKEKSGLGYYGFIKWDGKYGLSVGKEASLDIVNLETFEIEKTYPLAHDDSIRNICKFKHSFFGFIIFTYGEDQTIKMFKN